MTVWRTDAFHDPAVGGYADATARRSVAHLVLSVAHLVLSVAYLMLSVAYLMLSVVYLMCRLHVSRSFGTRASLAPTIPTRSVAYITLPNATSPQSLSG
ncbi:MAG: hypothetical protein LBQ66_09990 [Planctomycetaceae bacterium]|nr:hypothetical protein [Planctomycetaceae bacterium]